MFTSFPNRGIFSYVTLYRYRGIFLLNFWKFSVTTPETFFQEEFNFYIAQKKTRLYIYI